MVFVNHEQPYTGSSLPENSSNNLSSRPLSDSTSVSTIRNHIAQLHDKGKQKLSLAASTSKPGPETGYTGPESIPNYQLLTSGPSTTTFMSRNNKRTEKMASNFMVMQMSQSQSINVKNRFGAAKKKVEWPSLSVDPNLNLAIPGLPNEKQFGTEAARLDEREQTCVLSINQSNQPTHINSSIHLDSLELSASPPDFGSIYSISPAYNLFCNTSTSLEVSSDSQEKFLLPMETASLCFDFDTILRNASLNSHDNNLNLSQGISFWASNGTSTCPSGAAENKTNHMNQLSTDKENGVIHRLTLNGLVSPSLRETSSSRDHIRFQQQNWERASLLSNSVVVPQINQQSEFATEKLLTQNIPNNFDTALLANSEAQNMPATWPSNPNNFVAPFTYEDLYLRVTQTEQFLSNYTQEIPQSMLTTHTPWTPSNNLIDDIKATPSSDSMGSFSEELEPALEDNSIPDDFVRVDENGCFDPPLEYKGPKFPDDLYTPHWIRIKDNKRSGLCEHCYEENGKLWFFQIKCSAYRYHLNTFHGICTSGKRFADPLDKRTLADGSVEFFCHECHQYKHIQRSPQDDIFKWYRHAAQCHSSNRRANAHAYYKPKRL